MSRLPQVFLQTNALVRNYTFSFTSLSFMGHTFIKRIYDHYTNYPAWLLTFTFPMDGFHCFNFKPIQLKWNPPAISLEKSYSVS